MESNGEPRWRWYHYVRSRSGRVSHGRVAGVDVRAPERNGHFGPWGCERTKVCERAKAGITVVLPYVRNLYRSPLTIYGMIAGSTNKQALAVSIRCDFFLLTCFQCNSAISRTL